MSDPQEPLLPGKVPWSFVASRVSGPLPPDVLLGPAQGEDAALVKTRDGIFAIASDPITFASKDAGRLAVLINANDVAVRGAEPVYFTAVVLLAPGTRRKEAADLLDQIRDCCAALNIALLGGHTEVTPGLSQTVVVGTMVGRVKDRPITTGGLRPGDRLGMTKWAGLEGTSILLTDFSPDLEKRLGPLPRRWAPDWISICSEASLAASSTGVTAMHDVTEGGVGEALHEMARASGLWIEAAAEGIPLLPETAKICGLLRIDPLGLIGSGALLIGCAEEGAVDLEKKMNRARIPFAWIGIAEAPVDQPGTPLPRFERDELLKAFSPEGQQLLGKE